MSGAADAGAVEGTVNGTAGAGPGASIRVPGNDWTVLDGAHPPRPPLVSVIVAHYEQPADLARTLGALTRQTHPRVEVIVVDDGSAEPPVVPEGVTLIRLPDRGFRVATARNRGAAVARGDVLAFLDADTAPEPQYLAELARLPALRDDAVVVGRRRHAAFADGDRTPVEVAGPASELPEPEWLREAYARSHDLRDADQRSYRYVISAVLACSRAFFARTGGFDESFDEYGGEDWEWAHRAFTLGAVLAHVPTAVAWHNGPDFGGRSDDPAELRRRMNRESLLLLNRIGVAGSVGRGLRSAAPDVVVTLPTGTPPATAVCLDLVLEALPAARVVLDDGLAALFPGDDRVRGRSAVVGGVPDARVTVTADALFTVPRAARADFCAALARATEEVGVGELGWIGFAPAAADGPMLTVAAARAEHRSERRPDAREFTTERRHAPLRHLDDEPDLAAHLGGWAD